MDILQNLSTIELFNKGNYAEVARRKETDKWQTYAAMGLIGLFKDGHKGLDLFDDPQIQFYRAAIYWIEGKEDKASRLLDKIDTPHAKRLLGFIKKPCLNVLAQLSWTRSGSQDVLSGVLKDKKFKVENISFDKRDLPNEPYADIRKYYSAANPPDFFLSEMVEWHITPPNLQELPCPIIGQTSDYDIHVQALTPWLRIFDAFVAGDQSEWFDVGKLSGEKPIFTFPKFVGVPSDLPPIPISDRPLDFFVSGTVKHPYWPEKIKAIYELLSMSDIEYRVIQGFLPEDLYRFLLGFCKASFSCLRHPAAMPSRALEALSMGCAVIVQKDSVLGLYLDENTGLYKYDSTEHSQVDVLRHIVDHWDRVGKSSKKGADIVRRDFSLPAVSSQYFRFLTFLASSPSIRRTPADTQILRQKRMVVNTGFLPRGGDSLLRLRQATIDRCASQVLHDRTPQSFIDTTREILMYAASENTQEFNKESKKLFQIAQNIFKIALNKFPKSLVLKFNYIRSLYHFGSSEEKDLAITIARNIIEQDTSFWDVGVFDDVLAWDFFNEHFNYRSYFDSITQHLIYGTPCRDSLINIILASVNYYIGCHLEDISYIAKAHSLDPVFAHYQLSFVSTKENNHPYLRKEEKNRILQSLSNGSIVYDSAYRLLEANQREIDEPCEYFTTLKQMTAHLAKNTIDINKLQGRIDERNYRNLLMTLGNRNPNIKTIRIDAQKSISIIFIDNGKDNESLPALKNLRNQSIADNIECFVCHFGNNDKLHVLCETGSDKDIDFILVQFDPKTSLSDILNHCIGKAKGELIAVVRPNQLFDPRAFEFLVEALNSNKKAVLAYGDFEVLFRNHGSEVIGDQPIIAGYYRRPDFSSGILYQDINCELVSVWKKELHNEYKLFESDYGDSCIFAFFLKVGLDTEFVHLSEFIGLYSVDSEDKFMTIRSHYSNEAAIARERLWPRGWGVVNLNAKPPELISYKLAGTNPRIEPLWLGEWKLASNDTIRTQSWFVSLAKELIICGDSILAEVVLRKTISMPDSLITSHLMLIELYKSQGRYSEYNNMLKVTQTKARDLFSMH